MINDYCMQHMTMINDYYMQHMTMINMVTSSSEKQTFRRPQLPEQSKPMNQCFASINI